MLAGIKAVQLGLIQDSPKSNSHVPVRMFKCDGKVNKDNMQSMLASYPEVFHGLGNLKNHVVTLYQDKAVVLSP